MKGIKEINIILDDLLQLIKELRNSTYYPLSDLTNGKIQTILGSKNNIAGVYAISIEKPENIVYVGRSKNLAVRIGTDHRALQSSQANFTKFLLDEFKLKSMKEARNLLYKKGWVRFLRIDNVIERAILEIYAAVTFGTKYNSFMEH